MDASSLTLPDLKNCHEDLISIHFLSQNILKSTQGIGVDNNAVKMRYRGRKKRQRIMPI